MRNQTLTQKIQGQEMSVYDPYNLFEVEGKNIRLMGNLEGLCDELSKKKGGIEISRIECPTLKVSIGITQELNAPKRYKINQTKKEVVERVLSRITNRLKIDDGFVYYTIPVYGIEADFIFKNQENLEEITLCNDISNLLKQKGIYANPCFFYSTGINYMNMGDLIKLIEKDNYKEKYTMLLDSNDFIYVLSPIELIFNDVAGNILGIPVEQMLSGEEKAEFSKTLNVLKKLDLFNENDPVGLIESDVIGEPFSLNKKVNDNAYPVIKLDYFTTILFPQLVYPNLGFRYMTHKFLIMDYEMVGDRINNVLSIIPTFFKYASLSRSEREIIKSKNTKLDKYDKTKEAKKYCNFVTLQSIRIAAADLQKRLFN